MIWVITASEDAYGPYERYEDAYFFAMTAFGSDGCWTITRTDDEIETVKE